MLVPAGTPRRIVDLLHRETVEVMALPQMRERLSVVGFEPVASTPEELAQQVRTEAEKWAKAIRAANIKPE